MAETLDKVFDRIQAIRRSAADKGKNTVRPTWPMIVLKTPKGWTGPKEVDGVRIEGTFRAHQVPISDPAANPAHLHQLEAWMKSYRPEELFDEKGVLKKELADLAPSATRRMGANPHANGGLLLKELNMPDFRDYAIKISHPGNINASDTLVLGEFLRDIIDCNSKGRNFRIFGPDENTVEQTGPGLRCIAPSMGGGDPAGR